jgi:KipI family sensor histidine kinase inhibitor
MSGITMTGKGELVTLERYFIGDACIGWSLGNSISSEISDRVLRIYHTLKNRTDVLELGVRDIVPSYNAVAVHIDPATSPVQKIIDMIDTIVHTELRRESVSAEEKNRVTLPVCYTGEDLGRVASVNGLSIETVIRLHSAALYTVAMVGFLPHFPYLIGLDDRLVTPRLDNPRTHVPAGSVAIGGAQTGVYPRQSPGGWNIVGATDPKYLTPIKPGDTIKFEVVETL